MKQLPNTTTDVISELYNLIDSSKVVGKVYKGVRPLSVDPKIRSFAVVDCATRLKNTAENGGGMGKIISRVSVFTRTSVGTLYPELDLAAIEKAITDLFPLHGRISFNVLDVFPPTDDGKGFYYIIWQLNTTLQPKYEGT